MRSHDYDTEDEASTSPNFLEQLYKVLPYFIVIMMIFPSFRSTNYMYDNPAFSFARSEIYQAQKMTHLPGVSPDIPFYVDASFDKTYYKFSDKYRKIEEEVEEEYKHLLSRKCGQEKALKNNRMYQARFSGEKEKKKAEEMTMPSCEELKLRFIDNFQSGSTSLNQPIFSLARSGVYQAQKTTHLPGVSPDIPFYVDASFDKSYYRFSDKYRKIEEEVEEEYKHLLSRKCGQEKALKNNRMYQARFSGQEARKKAEQMPLPSCDELKSRFIDKFHS